MFSDHMVWHYYDSLLQLLAPKEALQARAEQQTAMLSVDARGVEGDAPTRAAQAIEANAGATTATNDKGECKQMTERANEEDTRLVVAAENQSTKKEQETDSCRRDVKRTEPAQKDENAEKKLGESEVTLASEANIAQEDAKEKETAQKKTQKDKRKDKSEEGKNEMKEEQTDKTTEKENIREKKKMKKKKKKQGCFCF